ncbi:MAG: hypothetical protein COY58_07685 [Gammaproteobacteria bacterium CG_4_10_14_0_8_um_filter_38_16]|nr:MAG: hypothetical protein COY58_07685 [Gammaproteobacteria bacterium CG_4_10_14_0_8_um_filter_38_16]PJA03432.1 MAG: hypothetical protein COX72_04935 [Gammaproteobacteria bacterium CG_4_10_14_0_2_um_filter_38_22]PJB10587.1 MAG: hypothetical protein CO120_03825 [Gammaproteobacteria bacterium CG_4_9_14_3_um_filter_38_9]
MNRYPDAQTTFAPLLRRSFRLHYLTLKHTIFFILAIAIIKTITSFLMVYMREPYLIDVIAIAGVLIALYFFSAALFSTHRAFTDKAVSVMDALRTVWKNGLRIYSALLGYIVGAVATIILMRLLVSGIDRLLHQEIILHNFLILMMIAVSTLYIAIFSLSFPLIVIDSNQSIFKVFHDSVVLSEKNKFGIALLFFLMGMIYTLVSPATLQEYFLTVYHLQGLYDFVVFCVFIPLFINILLMVVHDSKLKSVGEMD